MAKAKFGIVIAVAVVCSLAFAAPALAWTHGNFSATTDACAGCHVAHAAQAPKLLKTGPTQTQFCFLCHGDGGASAPYDVKIGKTTVGVTTYASTAGGFCEQQGTALTSRHNVWGLMGETGDTIDEDTKQFFVPGSTEVFTGSGFVCSSCHDPHAGGGVPDGSGYIDGSVSPEINPRLLRKSITVGNATYSGLNVAFGFETVGTFTYGNPSVDSGVYRVIEYASGSTNWCGGCHFKFNVGTDSGHTADAWGMYRHAFGVELDAVVRSGTYNLPNTAFDHTPLETVKTSDTGDDVLACLTCHRAHSSTVAASGWASSWPRSEGGTSSTSALLRMDNRGVCFNCHDAAQYNLPTP